VRSDRRPKWARRRAPEKGALLETLAGSVRCDEIHYTRSWDRVYSPVNCASAEHAVYWRVSAFLSPAAIPAFSPHQSTSWRAALLPNESTATVPSSTAGRPAAAIAPDADFDARWAASRTRGIAHERAVRRKLIVVAGVAGSVATAVAIAYTLLRP